MKNFSYRFKPDAKRFNFGSVFNILIVGGLIIVVLSLVSKATNLFDSFFGKSDSQKKEGEGGYLGEAPKNLDESKLSDRLNRLSNYMNTLFVVNQQAMIDCLKDLSGKELDWIYVKFGVRTYRHGFLDPRGNEDLQLFGWFDRRLDPGKAKVMEAIWMKSSHDYLPVDPHSEGIF